MTSKELGEAGELMAAEHLIANGYKILERNWFFGREELDIIAIDSKTKELVIVEVKTRNSDFFGDPIEAVGKGKRKIIVRGADEYVRGKDLDVEVRFDIIGIILNQKEQKLEHIDGAFGALW